MTAAARVLGGERLDARQARRRVLARDLAQHARRPSRGRCAPSPARPRRPRARGSDRPQHHPGLGHRLRVLRAGDAEVGQVRAVVLVEQDVPGLDVAVDDPGRVHVRERAEQLARERSASGSSPPSRIRSRRLPPGTCAITRYGRCSSMPKSKTLTMCGCEGAAAARASRLKRSSQRVVVGERVRHQLDRDLAVQRLVAREPHRRHPARAEVALEHVAAVRQRRALRRPHQPPFPFLPLPFALALGLAEAAWPAAELGSRVAVGGRRGVGIGGRGRRRRGGRLGDLRTHRRRARPIRAAARPRRPPRATPPPRSRTWARARPAPPAPRPDRPSRRLPHRRDLHGSSRPSSRSASVLPPQPPRATAASTTISAVPHRPRSWHRRPRDAAASSPVDLHS